MSKVIFFSILKNKLQLSRTELDQYWKLALNAELPKFVFDLISPSFLRLPQIHEAYVVKLGCKPVPINKDQTRRLILEALIEGPRYASELRELYTIPTDLRLNVVGELLADKKICFNYCPIGNCIAYELNRRTRAPDNLVRRLNTYLRANNKVSLYRFYLMSKQYDYSVLCMLASNIQECNFSNVGLQWVRGSAVLFYKEEKNDE